MIVEKNISEVSTSVFLNFLKQEHQLDYSGYSESFVTRRLNGLMLNLNIQGLDMLLYYVKQNPDYVNVIKQDLSINYTEMFRDPRFFYSLRNNVFPFLATYPTLKIWHAGCSTGEEVYSLAILLHEVGLLRRTKIIATDWDQSVLEKASSATFETSRMQEYTRNYFSAGGNREFSNYYSSGYGQFKFHHELRNCISFEQHNLVSDAMDQKFNLILCRNVMIYFNSILQNDVVLKLNGSLANLGYLGLGATETLSFNLHRHEFANIDKKERIYRKVSIGEWKNRKN